MCWVAGARARPACPEGVEPRMGDHSREPEDPHGTTNHWKALGQLGALGSEWNEAVKRLARQTLHAGTDGATTLYYRRFLTRRRHERLRHLFMAGETSSHLPKEGASTVLTHTDSAI